MNPSRLNPTLNQSGDQECPQCKGPMSLRPLAPYPVWRQVLFGASFVGFLLAYDSIKGRPHLLWLWTGVQILLGAALVFARTKAKRRIYRCVRCSSTVP